MDKRALKSKNAIIATFLALIKKDPKERITVKELCEKAHINKSTFYAHYRDLRDLHEQLEDQLIDQILSTLPRSGTYSIDQPEQFASDLYQALIQYGPEMDLLFPGSSKAQFGVKLEKAIRQVVGSKYPSFFSTPQADILLTYQIQGAFHTYLNYKDGDDVLIRTITDISKALIKLY